MSYDRIFRLKAGPRAASCLAEAVATLLQAGEVFLKHYENKQRNLLNSLERSPT